LASITAVANHKHLHSAATRAAKAAPEPKTSGMLSRVAGGSKSTTLGGGSASDTEEEESLPEEEEDADRFLGCRPSLDLGVFALTGTDQVVLPPGRARGFGPQCGYRGLYASPAWRRG
jgi:hypothetical protein